MYPFNQFDPGTDRRQEEFASFERKGNGPSTKLPFDLGQVCLPVCLALLSTRFKETATSGEEAQCLPPWLG